MPLSDRNQSIDLQSKSIDWFLCERDIDRSKVNLFCIIVSFFLLSLLSFFIETRLEILENFIIYINIVWNL